MFEDNHNINDFDQMIKSILEEGQEEVPAHLWDGISEGLDKAVRQKTIVLWWRRAAVSVAAAAAVAIAVVFNNRPDAGMMLNNSDGLIAVAEPSGILAQVDETPISPSIDMIPQSAVQAMESTARTYSEEIIVSQADSPSEKASEPEKKEDITPAAPATSAASAPQEYFPEDWGEEEGEKGKREISYVLSGLAATNSTRNQSRIGPMKAPAITSAPEKTGITETSTNSIYGLPISFGIGVRVGLNDRWSIGTGLNYSIMNRQFYGKYTDVHNKDNFNITSSDIRNTQHYIGIPVNAYYDIASTDRISFYAYGGGMVEKCISDNYNVLKTSIRHNERVKGLQFSANAGIGVEILMGNHLGFYIDPSLRYYFDCNQPKNIRTAQPLMLGFEIGLRARL